MRSGGYDDDRIVADREVTDSMMAEDRYLSQRKPHSVTI